MKKKVFFYLNFIEEEGHKTYIRNKYDKIFKNLPPDVKLYDENYKSISDFRHYLLNNDISFKYYFNEKSEKIKILKKNIIYIKNKEEKDNREILSNIDKKLLFNSYNENTKFFKGSKIDKVTKFFNKIEYNKSNSQEKTKILKDYLDNYFNVVSN